MVGHLVLVQAIGVRSPVSEPNRAKLFTHETRNIKYIKKQPIRLCSGLFFCLDKIKLF